MKIAMINGTEVKGCTHHIKEAFLAPLCDKHEVVEFTLPFFDGMTRRTHMAAKHLGYVFRVACAGKIEHNHLIANLRFFNMEILPRFPI